MRTLEWDEVLGLEKFMVEDNDEIIGMEIHVGKDWRNGYSEPDSVVKYSLEELSGGSLSSWKTLSCVPWLEISFTIGRRNTKALVLRVSNMYTEV